MNKKTRDALREEMPSIVRYINRIIASNPDLRNAGLKFGGLALKKVEPNPEIVTSRAAFREFISPDDCAQKLCISDTNPEVSLLWCADQNCPVGFHDAGE